MCLLEATTVFTVVGWQRVKCRLLVQHWRTAWNSLWASADILGPALRMGEVSGEIASGWVLGRVLNNLLSWKPSPRNVERQPYERWSYWNVQAQHMVFSGLLLYYVWPATHLLLPGNAHHSTHTHLLLPPCSCLTCLPHTSLSQAMPTHHAIIHY